MGDARALFESAREASRDAERARRQLLALEARALALAGGTPTGGGGGGGGADRTGRSVAALVDREEALRARVADDYALIDLACAVLYGTSGDGGLSKLVPPWWCDVLWWRYLADEGWARVAEAVGYSPRRCREVCSLAIKVMDAHGLAALAGRPDWPDR